MNLRIFAVVLFATSLATFSPQRAAAQDTGTLIAPSYLVNRESAFTASNPRFSTSFNLPAAAKLVVSFAPQYYTEFGIIPTADLRRWQQGQTARFLLRLTGVTDVRYIALPAGDYSVVARNRSAVANNAFAVKVRRFTKKVIDDGVTRTFVANKSAGMALGPNNWNGMGFKVPEGYSAFLEGTFSRGAGKNVRYYLLTEVQYRRFASGASFTSLLNGSDPTSLSFELNVSPGKYFLVVSNSEPTHSSLAITRELYQ